MADLESIIADMREYGTAGIDAYLGPHHMALCLKQQANIWADQLAALSHAAGQEAVAWMRRNVTYKAVDGRTDGERVVSERKVYDDDLPLYLRQDGEQCRAASVAPAEIESMIERLATEASACITVLGRAPEASDVRVMLDAAKLLRALSRGVPEGST